MIVVSNTSPISNLAAVGQLDYLDTFYHKMSGEPGTVRFITTTLWQDYDPTCCLPRNY
jgi:predicted nucleic acid-binding protein